MRRLLLAFGLILGLAAPSMAGAGHDHGEAAPAATGRAMPRAEAHGEVFEFVAVFQDTAEGHALLVFVDRFATNEPVPGAAVEIEVAGQSAAAVPQPDGTFLLRAPWLDRPGRHEMVVTVTAGEEADLLTAGLTLPDEVQAGPGVAPHDWMRGLTPQAAVAGVLGVLLGTGAMLVLRGGRRAAFGAVVLAAALAALLAARTARAHEGHGAEASAPGGEGPRRLPDGAVFLPKEAQRLLAIRTVVAAMARPGRVALAAGVVAADPNAAGRVQASQAGRIEIPDGGGLPHVGQAVRRGDVLALVAPAIGAVERGTLQVQAAELDAALRLAEQRYRRLAALSGSVAAREIDDARLEMEGARRRRAAAAPTLAGVETLRAPVSGVIAAAPAMAGALVEPNAVLFEVVDPARLWVQAVTADPAAAEGLRAAAASTAGGTRLRLEFVGRGLVLDQGATPLQFRILGPPPGLALGSPVNVMLETAAAGEAGIVLPRAAVVRQANGMQAVWEHAGAERFLPRAVRVTPLDGATVLVAAGITPGVRIVTEGAGLLDQVR